MIISLNCSPSASSRSKELSNLFTQLSFYYAEVAHYTVDTNGTVWQLLKRVVFSELLLCKLYKEFCGFNNSTNFYWSAQKVKETSERAAQLIKTYLANPPDYNETAITAVAETFATSERVGYVMHSQMGGIYVDFVQTFNNTMYIPVIVFVDKYGKKDDTAHQFETNTHERALNSPNWVGRMDTMGLVYNMRHYTYVRILLAMSVFSSNIGVVVLYNATNGRMRRFDVDKNDTDLAQIRRIEVFYFQQFSEAVCASNVAIPTIRKPETESRDEDDDVDANDGEKTWQKPLYQQLGKFRPLSRLEELKSSPPQ